MHGTDQARSWCRLFRHCGAAVGQLAPHAAAPQAGARVGSWYYYEISGHRGYTVPMTVSSGHPKASSFVLGAFALLDTLPVGKHGDNLSGSVAV